MWNFEEREGKGGSSREKKRYTPFEMATIVERMSAFNTSKSPRDYGSGEYFNPVEVHMASYIADNPGISATTVARDWNRTKGAVSQIIKKLEEKGVICREKEQGNDKTICLYVTEKGARLDELHREYDTRNYERFLDVLENYFSEEDIQKTFAVLDAWIELSMNWEPS